MTGERCQDLPRAQRRRVIAGAVLRTVLVAASVMVWGVRIITGARYPGL